MNLTNFKTKDKNAIASFGLSDLKPINVAFLYQTKRERGFSNRGLAFD